MYEDELKERIVLTKIFLWAWESNDDKYIQSFQAVLKREVQSYPKYGGLEKYWWRDIGITQKGSGRPTKTREELRDFKIRLNSFLNEVITDYFSKAKDWIKNPKAETCPTVQAILKEKIKESLTKRKKIDREVSLNEEYAKNLSSPSPQDKKENDTRTEILENQSEPLRLMCEKIKISGGIRVAPLVKELENHLFSSYKEKPKEALDNILKAKSIYQLAKDKNVDYRKLLYTLKSIRFRLSERNRGRIGWYISFNNLSFFEEIYPLIRMMWEFEGNRKGWIKFFKDQKGWEKSRVANFMKRRVRHKIIPSYFFNMPPKLFPPEFVSRVIKKDKEIIKLFGTLSRIADQELPNHQQLKEELRKKCSNEFTSLIDSEKIM